MKKVIHATSRNVQTTSINYTTYKRMIHCDECGKEVTHEGVIDLWKSGSMWRAVYYCDQKDCPKCGNCKYTKTRRDTKPPIMSKNEFKAKVKKLDALDGFIIVD